MWNIDKFVTHLRKKMGNKSFCRPSVGDKSRSYPQSVQKWVTK